MGGNGDSNIANMGGESGDGTTVDPVQGMEGTTVDPVQGMEGTTVDPVQGMEHLPESQQVQQLQQMVQLQQQQLQQVQQQLQQVMVGRAPGQQLKRTTIDPDRGEYFVKELWDSILPERDETMSSKQFWNVESFAVWNKDDMNDPWAFHSYLDDFFRELVRYPACWEGNDSPGNLDKIPWSRVLDRLLAGLKRKDLKELVKRVDKKKSGNPGTRAMMIKVINAILRDRAEEFEKRLGNIRDQITNCKQGPEERPSKLAKRMALMAEKTQLSSLPCERIKIQDREDLVLAAFEDEFREAISRMRKKDVESKRPPRTMFCEGKQDCPDQCTVGLCNLEYYDDLWENDSKFIYAREAKREQAIAPKSSGRKSSQKLDRGNKAKGVVRFNSMEASAETEGQKKARIWLWETYGNVGKNSKPKAFPKDDLAKLKAQLQIWQAKLCRICLKDGHHAGTCSMRAKRGQDPVKGTWGEFGRILEAWHGVDGNAERLKQARYQKPTGSKVPPS